MGPLYIFGDNAEDRLGFEENVKSNIKHLVQPCLERLEQTGFNQMQSALLGIWNA